MPTTIYPFEVSASPIEERQAAYASRFNPSTDLDPRVVQSSLEAYESIPFVNSQNGFIYAVVEAYNNHYRLQIRPEDVWMAILTRFSFYINSHAELHDKIVTHEDHEGQPSISLRASENRYDDFLALAKELELLLDKKIIHPEVRRWMKPNFTTTTEDDIITASIIMMGTLKKYYCSSCRACCGIPSITLLGEKKDYQEILQRLDTLETWEREWGMEAAQFAGRLKPVIVEIIRTFDDPHDRSTQKFWKQILSIESGSGFKNYTGWITVFAAWDDETECLCPASAKRGKPGPKVNKICLRTVKGDKVPAGITRVPVKVHLSESTYSAMMVAGSIGLSFSSSDDSSTLDTIQPVAGWWMYKRDSNQTPAIDDS